MGIQNSTILRRKGFGVAGFSKTFSAAPAEIPLVFSRFPEVTFADATDRPATGIIVADKGTYWEMVVPLPAHGVAKSKGQVSLVFMAAAGSDSVALEGDVLKASGGMVARPIGHEGSGAIWLVTQPWLATPPAWTPLRYPGTTLAPAGRISFPDYLSPATTAQLAAGFTYVYVCYFRANEFTFGSTYQILKPTAAVRRKQ